jgi:hypothetical protein
MHDCVLLFLLSVTWGDAAPRTGYCAESTLASKFVSIVLSRKVNGSFFVFFFIEKKQSFIVCVLLARIQGLVKMWGHSLMIFLCFY